MKKYLLVAVAVVSFSLNGYSQCTPDVSITTPGIFPDSATNLPHAYVGIPYTTVMQVRTIKDTSTLVIGIKVPVTVDTIFLVSMTGFPPGGYTYTCNPSTCYFMPLTNGCVTIQGPAPTLPQAGMKYPLTAIVRTSAHLTGSSTRVGATDTLRYYYIQVDNTTGVNALGSSKFSINQNHPNPFNRSTLIEVNSPTNEVISLSVSNLLGKTIMSKTMLMQPGNNKITLFAKDFEPGIYFYTVTTDKQSVTRRMIVDYE